MDKNLFKTFMYVIVFFLLINFFQQCNVNRKLNIQRKYIDSLKTYIVILENKIEKLPSKKDIKIEGLKVEKRMIQATYRKILDVNRQNDIEKEIERLEYEK